MSYQPFYYTPTPSPTTENRRMSFIPRPRLVPKSFDVTGQYSQPTANFVDAVSIPFCGVMTIPTPKKDRKAAEAEAQRIQLEEELKANGGKPDEAAKERVAISELCNSLQVEMKEVGHRERKEN